MNTRRRTSSHQKLMNKKETRAHAQKAKKKVRDGKKSSGNNSQTASVWKGKGKGMEAVGKCPKVQQMLRLSDTFFGTSLRPLAS